tara:strand:- start:865 stop:1047 length:183 start_codon:yes stop_codon:yes gene_type:complete
MREMQVHNKNFVTITFQDRVYLINNEDKKVYQCGPTGRMSKKMIKLYDKLDNEYFTGEKK